ncbi:MAG TPA: phosphate ABC transporter permease subunit PstC, partial [Rhodoblastus sp.]|nr:phosphate ABC transporter permease subunit PstC [Rhodoblastus sp.]
MTSLEIRDGSIARPPSAGEIGMNRGFRILAFGAGFATIGLLLFILFIIGEEAFPAMVREGLGFLTRNVWSPGQN